MKIIDTSLHYFLQYKKIKKENMDKLMELCSFFVVIKFLTILRILIIDPEFLLNYIFDHLIIYIGIITSHYSHRDILSQSNTYT